MKRFLMSLFLLVVVSFAVNAMFILPYDKVNFAEFEQTSERTVMSNTDAKAMYNIITLSSDITPYLLDEGYYNISYNKGGWGIWMMILADGKWFTLEYIYNANNEYIGCCVTKYKYIGD